MTFEFKIDPVTGQVAGSTLSGTMSDGFHAQSTVVGELQEVAGLLVLKVHVADPPPARSNAFHRTYSAELVAYPTAAGWLFSAPFWPDNNAMARRYVDMVEVVG